ncbi:MAG: hypothetical protein AAF548_07420 [Actinomycetota bacterium]
MSRSWLDPFGIRGSKLDPFAFLSDTLAGRGAAADSAGRVATTLARQLVGERVEVGSSPRVAATVERIEDVRPAVAGAAIPGLDGQMPLWSSLAGRLTDVEIDRLGIDRVDVSVENVRVAATGDRVHVGSTEFTARVSAARAREQAAALEQPIVLRFDNGVVEMTEPRLERWFWVEMRIGVEAQKATGEIVGLRFRSFSLPVPRRLRKPRTDHVAALPEALCISEVRVEGDAVVAEGTFEAVDLPIDMTALMADLASGTTRSMLRIAFGG